MDESNPRPAGLSRVALGVRVLLVAVLLLTIGGWFFDQRARRAAEAAHARVDAALNREDTLDPVHTIQDEPLTPVEVERLVGKPPDGPGEAMGDEMHTSYS